MRWKLSAEKPAKERSVRLLRLRTFNELSPHCTLHCDSSHPAVTRVYKSTGGFTPDAASAARNSRIHIELIDEERFIRLWQDFYPKMVDEDKALLPLVPVYLLAPSE